MKKLSILFLLLSLSINAQLCKITTFRVPDGTLTWSSSNTDLYYGVEYTTNLSTNQWDHPDEPEWWNIKSTNDYISTQIPMFIIDTEDQMFFRIVSSPSIMPPSDYIDLSIGYWPSSSDKWWLQVHRVLTTEEVTRVFVTGEYIVGEYDLSIYGTEYGFQRWTSYDDGNYNLGGEPVLPTDSHIHIVSELGTNTETRTVSSYVTH